MKLDGVCRVKATTLLSSALCSPSSSASHGCTVSSGVYFVVHAIDSKRCGDIVLVRNTTMLRKRPAILFKLLTHVHLIGNDLSMRSLEAKPLRALAPVLGRQVFCLHVSIPPRQKNFSEKVKGMGTDPACCLHPRDGMH